jgi:hypothetical protein
MGHTAGILKFLKAIGRHEASAAAIFEGQWATTAGDFFLK